MLCVIYSSTKRDKTYLYVEKKDDFSRVPQELMKNFGTPRLVMVPSLDERKKLASADSEKVKKSLRDEGDYLQFPPPPENLLNTHLSG
ncbi:YcgL domain-containing protein [Serratia symbiotica]|uniref:YcgL domain-containing protein n=1 Tax=Serratia symbiotica TaxID=138074 RepID=UPI001D46DBE6|nr:YcgL domain-containing protein [Serratia symbiotica]NIG87610.1 hypothetical protein [Serratia symbiotica]USS96379.1 YcgL domain-containing protein [Serratia symbiotica]